MKFWREAGHVKEKERESQKDIFLPGMDFQKHSALDPQVVDDLWKKINRKVTFKAQRKVIEPGINMKLIKKYYKACKEYPKFVNSLPKTIYLVKDTYVRITKFENYMQNKRKRDLFLINTTIKDLVNLIREVYWVSK